MGASFDFKKEFISLYMPGLKPAFVNVPAMKFIMIEGRGDPNLPDGEYAQAMQALYALSYAIKMSKNGPNKPEDYFEYVVPPLEGLWWMEGMKGVDIAAKHKFHWISMIRQPDFVTDQVFERAKASAARKHPSPMLERTRLQTFEEGLCAQVMHIGPYDEEKRTIEALDAFITESGKKHAMYTLSPEGIKRRHHEIYLSDPRKADPAAMKTVIRHPVA